MVARRATVQPRRILRKRGYRSGNCTPNFQFFQVDLYPRFSGRGWICTPVLAPELYPCFGGPGFMAKRGYSLRICTPVLLKSEVEEMDARWSLSGRSVDAKKWALSGRSEGAQSHRKNTKKCVSPLFEEFRQTSQDTFVSDQISEVCWDVCPNSSKSGFSSFWGKYMNTCSRRIAPKKYQKVRFATFQGISTNVPGFLRFRSDAGLLLGRLP